MILLQQKNQLAKVLETNEMTARYGLVLTQQDAELLAAERSHVLKRERRVEFGPGILPKVIEQFCDSDFIDQNNYVDTKMKCRMRFPMKNCCIL